MLIIGLLAVLSQYYYRITARCLRLLCHGYFRKIAVYGINNLPREGPVIVCPNHPNMMVDVYLVLTEIMSLGRIPFVWAKGSLFSSPWKAWILHRFGAVPVYRPNGKFNPDQDRDSDKSPEEISKANQLMFQHTWDVLHDGGLMVLFPEGTSYTAPKMLNLRTGVIRVGTGFVKKYAEPITIVPLGLTYFNKDKFRSEVMMEFGKPMIIDENTIKSEAYLQDDHAETKRLTHVLEKKMYDITINAQDFDTIEIARDMRKLYLGRKIIDKTTEDVRFIQAIINSLENADDANSEKLAELKEEVRSYEEKLSELRIKDIDLVFPMEQKSAAPLFFERLAYLLILIPLAMPGLLLSSPIYYIIRKVTKRVGFVESRSMIKMAVGAILIPLQWVVFILLAWAFFGSTYAYILGFLLPLVLYSHVRVLEEGRSILENTWFLLHFATRQTKINMLREERAKLAESVKKYIDTHVDPAILSKINNAHEIEERKLRLRTPSRYDTLYH